MVEFFGFSVPYFGYIASGIGIIMAVYLFWLIFRNSGNQLLKLEKREISEDKELLNYDRKIRRLENEKRSKAERLYELLRNLHGISNTFVSREAVGQNTAYFKLIAQGLNELIKGKIGIAKQKEIVDGISQAIDKYVTNITSNLKNIMELTDQVRSAKSELVEIVLRQFDLIKSKEELLRTEFMETQQEKAA